MYKVSLSVPGVSIYRMKSIQGTIDFLNNSVQHRGIIGQSLNRALLNKNQILKLSQFLLNLKGEYCQRIERNQIDFYTNDETIHSQIIEAFTDCVRLSFKPRANSLDILESNKFILCNKLPHKKYKFKAYLLPHKIKDLQDKNNIVGWLKNADKVLISDSTANWFIQTSWYWDRRYIYIEDEASMLLVQMRCAGALGRIYEYVISDK